MINSFTGKYRFLSNFYPHFVSLDHLMYPTNEHAFQAAKTMHLRTRLEIGRAPSPGSAKRMGKALKNTPLMREDWQKVNLGIMLNLLREKFIHPQLREWLLLTGHEELIEGNT